MKKFLSAIIDDIDEGSLETIHQRYYVFPTRRSCIIFNKLLLDQFPKQTFWAPKVLSIEDFIIEVTGLKVTDDVALIFELYEVYKKHDTGVKFQDFYPWGQILLKDFDEIDRYLSDGNSIYEGLQNIREIEARFNSNDELLEIIRNFRHIVEESQTELFKRFAETWKVVRKVYPDYRKHLSKKGMAYTGMLYRTLVESLQKGHNMVEFSEVVFGGFNALSKAEEEIIDLLLKEKKAIVYWDADLTYLEDKKEEAGRFLREYRDRWKTDRSKWILSDKRTTAQNIVCVGAAESVGQARAASSILKTEFKERNIDSENTAVVFGDEELLFPVLHSLPSVFDNVNVTMGYPMKNNALIHLAKHFIDIFSKKESTGANYFLRKPIVELVNNPFIRPLTGDLLIGKLRGSASNVISTSELFEYLEGTILGDITETKIRSSSVLQALIKLLYKIFNAQEKDKEELVIEKELLYHFIKEVLNFDKRLKLYEIELDMDVLSNLLVEAIQSISVPFSGEPVMGLQLMGFLETRTLDFENLIVLSVNEGKLPAVSNQSSYIPFSLRKAFGLPTYEEQDAIYAYHFKRLLQRAKNIWLIYNTEMAYDGSGERSRFILQLILESKKNGRDIRFVKYTAPIKSQIQVKPPNIHKTKDVYKKLDRFLVPDQMSLSKVSRLSPSALITYINCPLQFYFKYVAGLREPEDVQLDSLEPRNFGNIVHKALDILYRPLIGRELGLEDAKKLKQGLSKAVNEAFIYERNYDTIKGKDLLAISITESIIKKVIKNDFKEDGFRIVDVEMSALNTVFKVGERSVELGGVVDRIDEIKLNGAKVKRIIDYKTGNVDYVKADKLSEEEFVGMHFEDSKYKTGFQALYYSYLFSLKNPDQEVMPGIYELKRVGEGIINLQNKPLSDVVLAEFAKRLRMLIESIFDQSVIFVPTDDESKCRICDYKSICHR